MTSFTAAIVSYPTAIYTVLLAVVLFYWILGLIGIVDISHGDMSFDTDLHTDIHADDIGELASHLVAFGLNGVPISLVITLMVLFAWTLNALAGMWLLPLVPTTGLRLIAGTAILLLGFAASIPATALAIRPMRGLFVTHRAQSNTALVGQSCIVLTGNVDEQFGRAEVGTRGSGLNIKVWAKTPNELTKGSRATIIDYDPNGERYLIVAEL